MAEVAFAGAGAQPARVAISLGTGSAAIEFQWVGPVDPACPIVVFLHEGLGSASMWRDYPRILCDSVGWRGLVYSRPGFGRSGPPASGADYRVDFMHREAWETLPALLDALAVDAARCPVWLLGHSDGASIALLYAARHPRSTAGLVLLAPHLFVEDLTIASIEQSRDTYRRTDLPTRLARHHDDADAVFWRWNRVWLLPEFRQWNITDEIGTVGCPVLAVQGREDEYGTLSQLRRLAQRLPQARTMVLPDCRHSPHRDQPELLGATIRRFVAAHGVGTVERAADPLPVGEVDRSTEERA